MLVGAVLLAVFQQAPSSARAQDAGTDASEVASEQSGAAPGSQESAPLAVDDGFVELEDFVVRSELVPEGSKRDLEMKRFRADVPQDFMTVEMMDRVAAGDLADAVNRISGVSVANGQFAVVRGLGDRFLSTTLHGLKMPSPDPEKQAVQLDLLPSSMAEAVIVSKAFEPMIWADSSGGNMDILFRTVPEQRSAKLGVALKHNTNTSDGGLDYAVRDNFWKERLGKGSDLRLPAGVIDTDSQFVPTRRSSLPIGTKLSLEYSDIYPIRTGSFAFQVAAFNEASSSGSESLRIRRAALDGRAPFPGGPNPRPGRPPLPPNPGYANELETGVMSDWDGPVWSVDQTDAEKTTGASLGVLYRFSPSHELSLRSLYVQNSIDRARVSETPLTTDPETGMPELTYPDSVTSEYNNDANHLDYDYFESLVYFRERNLTLNQLAGRHKFPLFEGVTASWQIQRATTYQKTHPYVRSRYTSRLDDLYNTYGYPEIADVPGRFIALWQTNEDTQDTARLDFDIPVRLWGEFIPVFKVGGAYEKTVRSLSGHMRYPNELGLGDIALDGASPEEVVDKYMLAILPDVLFDGQVDREIKAAYLSLNLPLTSRLKLTGGARFESFYLEAGGVGNMFNYYSTTFYGTREEGYVNGFGHILGTTSAGAPPFKTDKWYPGVSATFDLLPEKLRLRVSYSRTDARPSLREVSPQFNLRDDNNQQLIGNPALRPSEVTNYDVRLEWTPGRFGMLSVSGFRKTILNAIEKMTFETENVAVSDTESWVNNPTEAELKGIEVEFSHNFESWSETLRGFSLAGNFTLIDAEVGQHPLVVANRVPVFQDPANIPAIRRLFDQPEHIGNLSLNWSKREWGCNITLSGYGISDVLVSANLANNTFDEYERAYYRLDFVWSQQITRTIKMRLAVKNLNNPVRGVVYDRERTVELYEADRYRAGREFSVALTRSF